MATQVIPLNIAIAPFPEGFQGDMDETFQQACQLMEATIAGNFLTGLILPPGSTLPTTDQGPIAMGDQWYFFDPVTGVYLPQSVSVKLAHNYVKNPIYQIQQLGASFTVAAGISKTYDLSTVRATAANVLSITPDTGPAASVDTDFCPSAIRYTVGPSIVATLAAADLYAHEHLVEGADIAGIQGELMTLGFNVWCNQSGTYSAYLTNTGRDMSYVFNFTIATASQWTRIKVTNIPAMPTGTGTWGFGEGVTGLYLGIGMAVGSQWQTPTPKQWVSGFFAGTSTNSNLCTVTNNQMKITAVKLEASPTPTYLSVNSFSQDYEDCIRYYFTTFEYQSLTGGVPIISTASAVNTVLFSQLFPRRMARVPTVVPYGWTTHAPGNITNTTSGADIACASIPATRKGIAGQVTATGTKGDTFGAIITVDARLA